MSKSNHRLLAVAAGFVGVGVLTGICFFLWSLSQDSELSNKSEWSSLQYVELNYRDKFVSQSAIFEVAGTNRQYRLVGLPSKDGRSTVWVLLNPEHSPYYKQMPESVNFTLTREDLSRIRSREKTHSEVLNKLAEMAGP